MKTKSLIVLSIAVITLCNAASAQHAPKTDGAYINGLKVGDKCTMAQLINVLGEPQKIEKGTILNDFYILHYGTDSFFWANGEFYGGELKTNKYSFCGTVKVGDSIAIIDKLHGISAQYTDNDKPSDGYILWQPNYPDKYEWGWLQVQFDYDKNGKIVRISAIIPIFI